MKNEKIKQITSRAIEQLVVALKCRPQRNTASQQKRKLLRPFDVAPIAPKMTFHEPKGKQRKSLYLIDFNLFENLSPS